MEKQFKEEELLHAMREVDESDARRKYGDELLVAAIGAIDKGDSTFRVIHDGTHAVQVNPRLRTRDQHRSPGSGEIKTVLRLSNRPGSILGLTGDVKRAHRLPRVREDEWGYQACQLRPGRIWLNEVGTFGVGSIAYHWARLAGGACRAILYLMGTRWLFQLLYADDFNWSASGPHLHEDLLLAVFFLRVMGMPLSWKKFKGGFAYEWVGYWQDFEQRAVGISEGRARWLADWCQRTLADGSVHAAEFRSVLGRFGFALNALETFKPFLGPMHAWSSASPPQAVLLLPVMIRLVLKYLMNRLREGSRLAPCGDAPAEATERFRADAKAEGDDVCIGGWEIVDADADTMAARWYSERLTRVNAPWVFDSGEPFRVIAALELLGTLACVVAFPVEKRPEGIAKLTLGGTTDNMGNRDAVSKLSTTKFPLSAVLMELAAQLHQRGLAMELQWAPRLQNWQADALSNGDFRGFDPTKRVRVDMLNYKWLVLNEMITEGSKLYKSIREAKVEKSKRLLHKTFVKGLKSFREREPWK